MIVFAFFIGLVGHVTYLPVTECKHLPNTSCDMSRSSLESPEHNNKRLTSSHECGQDTSAFSSKFGLNRAVLLANHSEGSLKRDRPGELVHGFDVFGLDTQTCRIETHFLTYSRQTRWTNRLADQQEKTARQTCRHTVRKTIEDYAWKHRLMNWQGSSCLTDRKRVDGFHRQ